MNKSLIAITVAVLAFILSHQVSAQPAEESLQLMSGDLVLFTGDSDDAQKSGDKKKDKKKLKKKEKKKDKKLKKKEKRKEKKEKKKKKKKKKPNNGKDECSRDSASDC